MREKLFPSVGIVAAQVVFALAVAAQDARVVSCNSSNGRVLDLNFTSQTSSVLINDGARVTPQSCLFRDNGTGGLHLLIADRNGEVVFYQNAIGLGAIVLGINPANPAHPDGLSEDPAQNLYGVTSATGSSADAIAKVWMLRRDANGSLPGGYAGPVGYIDSSIPGVSQLAETVFVTSNLGSLNAGDLLVLASDPPQVLRYRAADLALFKTTLAAGQVPAELVPDVFIQPPTAAVPAGQKFPAGITPNGMDLTQEGSLLVSAGQGSVLHYLANGTRKTDGSGNFVDFATGLGNGPVKIATGFQGGSLRAFVTERNGGKVHRFKMGADGRGLLDSTIVSAESPNGIATTTAAVKFTPAGAGVVVTSSDLIVSTIENVPVAGLTAITEYVFSDPRESEAGAPSNPSLPLHRALNLNAEISSLLPAGVTIPAHVRAFRKADPVTGLPTGAPTFLLLVAATSAEVAGTIQHIADESLVLGYEPNCSDPNPTLRPRLFWRDNPDTDEIPTPEGDFINVSNGCGTSRGLTMFYSLFLTARDTRPTLEIADAQLDGIGVALANAQCVRQRTLRAMERQFEVARREFDRGRISKTVTALQSLLAAAESAPADFAPCESNEGGNIRARVRSAIFTLSTP